MKVKTNTKTNVKADINALEKEIKGKTETINTIIEEIKDLSIQIFKLKYPNFVDGAIGEYTKGKEHLKGKLLIRPSTISYILPAEGCIIPYKKDGTLSNRVRIVFCPEDVKVVE